MNATTWADPTLNCGRPSHPTFAACFSRPLTSTLMPCNIPADCPRTLVHIARKGTAVHAHGGRSSILVLAATICDHLIPRARRRAGIHVCGIDESLKRNGG